MSGHALSSPMSCCGIKLLVFAIAASAWQTAVTRADERPANSSAATVTAASAESSKANDRDIQKLIRDLGSSNFAARRQAANEIRQIGTRAFDLLYAATDDTDPEIASSASYLLQQIPIRWVQSDDPATIRPLMRQYSLYSEAARSKTIEELDKLSVTVNTAALCRIARYDRSQILSRKAAMAIIQHPDANANVSRPDADVVDRELGASTRSAAHWIRQYLTQLHDPAASVAGWRQLIEQESSRLENSSGDTSHDIVLGLTWNVAEIYRQIGDAQALHGAQDRIVALAADATDDMLPDLIEWLAETKSWDAVDTFLTKYQSRFEQSKKLLYYAALARAKQGKREVSEELAAKAAALPPQSRLEDVLAAREMEQHGQFDWAVREYRRAIEKQPADSLNSISARIYLPSLLHDYERDKEAADTLEPLFKAVRGEGRLGQRYMELRQTYAAVRYYGTAPDSDSDRSALPSPKILAARYHGYRGYQFQQAKDWKQARAEMEQAISFDPEDADVLIAMYRLPDSDKEFRTATLSKIRDLEQKFQHQIDEDPTDAGPYNQWAWLVSNTEGDFQKAIRYSHRSLELTPSDDQESGSFLDTLGRCYYAAGDYKNAVKYERLAIEKVKFVQVMHRQLAQFEKALADQQGLKKN